MDALAAIRAATELRIHFKKILEKWMQKWQMYVPDKIEISKLRKVLEEFATNEDLRLKAHESYKELLADEGDNPS